MFNLPEASGFLGFFLLHGYEVGVNPRDGSVNLLDSPRDSVDTEDTSPCLDSLGDDKSRGNILKEMLVITIITNLPSSGVFSSSPSVIKNGSLRPSDASGPIGTSSPHHQHSVIKMKITLHGPLPNIPLGPRLPYTNLLGQVLCSMNIEHLIPHQLPQIGLFMLKFPWALDGHILEEVLKDFHHPELRSHLVDHASPCRVSQEFIPCSSESTVMGVMRHQTFKASSLGNWTIPLLW